MEAGGKKITQFNVASNPRQSLKLRDLGSNIRVASVSPGIVVTDFAEVATNSKEVADSIYNSNKTLQVKDMANHIKHILELPKHVHINDIVVQPTGEVF